MEPASIRFKNPGAMWGNALAKKWGSTETVTLHDGLGQGNNIAVFPTYVQGISAQLDLWRSSPNYKNKRFADAIAIWSGHNNVESYIHFVLEKVPGMTRDTIMNDTFWKGPMGIAFLKAQAGHEAGKTYPAPVEDWIEAQRRVFSKVPAITKASTTVATSSVSLWQMYVNKFEPWLIAAVSIIVAIAVIYLVYYLLETETGKALMDKVKAFLASAWDWAKRIFGRSRTVFLNVMSILSVVFVEMSDSLTSLNLDDFFKHEVSVVIMLVVQVLNVILRLNTTGAVSFKRLEEVDVPAIPVPPVAPVEPLPPAV